MSTGYYMYGKSNYLSKVKQYLKYLIFGEIVACSSLIIKALLLSSVDSLLNTLSSNINIKTIFFKSLFNGTLWYLYAMIWTYIFLFAISKWRYGFKVCYYLIPVLLLIHIAGRVYVTKYYDINELVYLFRSALLFAVPFVLIGRLIAQMEIILKKYLNYVSIGIVFCIGMALMIYEYFKWQQFMDLQVSTIFISVAMFLFALYRPDFQMFGVFKYIGKNLLIYIYLFHIPVINVLYPFFVKMHMENSNWATLMVVMCTVAISYVWNNLSRMIQNRTGVNFFK